MVQLTRRATFVIGLVDFVAIEVTSGAVEIYDHYDDGMERFVGYVTDANVSSVVRRRAFQALYAAGVTTYPVQLAIPGFGVDAIRLDTLARMAA